MRKAILIFLLLLNLLLIFSCDSTNKRNPLPGKIFVSRFQTDDCYIYVNSDSPKIYFKQKHDSESQFSPCCWLNTKDSLIGIEYIPGYPSTEKSNIIMLNLNGKLVDRIYEPDNGILAWSLFPSRDDKYFLFTTHPTHLDTPSYLVIMDLENKKIIKKIEINNILAMEESPWLYKGYRFIYRIFDETRNITDGKTTKAIVIPGGIYLFDLNSGERQLLVPGGSYASASPTCNQIVYEKDNDIKVLDLNTNQEKTIYHRSLNGRVQGVHWTPDGKFIYFAHSYEWGFRGFFRSSGEKLIEVSTGKEKPFKKIANGFNPYSWK